MGVTGIGVFSSDYRGPGQTSLGAYFTQMSHSVHAKRASWFTVLSQPRAVDPARLPCALLSLVLARWFWRLLWVSVRLGFSF